MSHATAFIFPLYFVVLSLLEENHLMLLSSALQLSLDRRLNHSFDMYTINPYAPQAVCCSAPRINSIHNSNSLITSH